MATEDEVRYDVKDHVATVTLNRPEVLNAFTRDTIRLLISRLEDAAEDRDVRVVVLTGAGKGFCPGADVRAMAKSGAAQRTPDEARQELRSLVRASELLHTMPKPTIAAVNGACAGAGLSLACAADLRYAAESAVFATAFARVGLTGDYGGIWLASKILGASARQLFFLGDKVRAPEAKDLGLVAECIPDDAFAARVSEIAGRLAAMAPLTLAGMKANFNVAESVDFAAYLDEETATFIRVRGTKDAREAARAFAEKRAPVFVGE